MISCPSRKRKLASQSIFLSFIGPTTFTLCGRLVELHTMPTDGITDTAEEDEVLNETARGSVEGLQTDIQEMEASTKNYQRG